MRFGTLGGRFVLVGEAGPLDVTGSGGRRSGPAPLALDVADASDGRFGPSVTAALGDWAALRRWAPTADWSRARPVGDEELGPPVPDPRQVFAIALNYRPHAAEAGFRAPDEPLVFTKFPSCLAGPVTDVVLPEGHVDWEIEIVAVIGAGGRDIPLGRAWDAVAGLTVGQDLSERIGQLAGTPPQFGLAKSHAGFGPIGPVAVTPDALPDPDDIGFHSTLDGEPLQSGRTSEMIFGIDELVARLSRVCALFPGDLVFTGTPAGVGNRADPPRFLRPGETLVSTADGIGSIRQHFVAPS